jgi:hypothetical protein
VQDLLIHEVLGEILKTQCPSVIATKVTINRTFQKVRHVPGTVKYGAAAQLHGGGGVLIYDKQRVNVGG